MMTLPEKVKLRHFALKNLDIEQYTELRCGIG